MITTLLTLFLLHKAQSLEKVNFHQGYANYNHVVPRTLEPKELASSFLMDKQTVLADFGQSFYEINGISSLNDTLMFICISSNETALIIKKEKHSKQFNCDSKYCTQDDSVSYSYDSEWVSGTGTRIYLNESISIANGAWKLQNPALYITNLTSHHNSMIPSYGSIGLGTGAEAYKNFKKSDPIFSVLIDPQTESGELIFGFNSSIVNNSSPTMVLESDENWQLAITSISFGSSVYSNPEPLTMAFNLAARGIGIPEIPRDYILEQMEAHGMQCFGSGCYCTNLTGLPNLVFILADNTEISLSPEIYTYSYMSELEMDYMTVTMWARKRHFSEDAIIVGSDVMAQFYTVFQQKKGINTISLYQLNNLTLPVHPLSSNEPNDQPEISNASPPTSNFMWIVLGVIISILICASTVIFTLRKKRPNNIQSTGKVLASMELTYTTNEDIGLMKRNGTSTDND